MKIAFGMKLGKGPFGGGNQFGNSLVEFFGKKKWEVVHDLNHDDIDVIFITDPRGFISSAAFSPVEVLSYIRNVNKNVLVMQRINECDERKGTKTVNEQLFLTNNHIVDYTIFIASWLPELFKKDGYELGHYSVVLNGADDEVFFKGKRKFKEDGKIKLVTHHWGASRNKGWDIYEELNNLMFKDKYKNLEFHFIGNYPEKSKELNKNIIFHSPCNGEKLSNLLKSKDIYITASINEPAGMHHVEGALCGLPLLYIRSGALPEYCDGFGVSFSGVDDFEESLDEMIKNHNVYKKKVLSYENNSKKMCKEYYDVIKATFDKKDLFIKNRKQIIYKKRFVFLFVFRYFKYFIFNKYFKIC